MLPIPAQGGWTHPPPRGTLQTVAEGDVPRGEVKDSPTDGALAVYGRHCTAHVAQRVDPIGVSMDCPGTNSKRDHRHTGHRPTRHPVEGGGGDDRNLSTRKPSVALCLTQVMGKKRDRDGYNGVEDCSSTRQHIARPHITDLPGPKEFL